METYKSMTKGKNELPSPIQVFILLALLIIGLIVPLRPITSNAQQINCIHFIPTDHSNPSGDAIPLDWKVNGIPYTNSHGIPSRYKLPGANPLHRDLYVEVDYMQNRKPIQKGIDDVVRAFANAPVCNPDGTKGINLHVQIDEQIPFIQYTDVSQIPLLKSKYFGTVEDRLEPNLISIKKLVYHYAVFANDQGPGVTYSGVSEGIPSMNFIVSLGSWPRIDNTTHQKVGGGTVSDQEGSFMHELGHNLALHHSGSSDLNYAPNYLSVMNYAFQLPSYVANRSLDYSRCVLSPLNENRLDEISGIPASPDCAKGRLTVAFPFGDCNMPSIFSLGIPYDWDQDGDLPKPKTDVAADVNCDGSFNTLSGYSDWNHLVYRTGNTSIVVGIPSSNIGISVASNASTIHHDISLGDVRKARLGLLNHIKSVVNELPNSAFVSKPAATNTTRGLGLPVPSIVDVHPKAIINNIVGLANDTKALSNQTNAVKTSSGMAKIVATTPTIASNLQKDNIGPAINQLSKLKILVGNPKINATNSLIKDSRAQRQLDMEINNLIGVLRQQQ